MPLSLKIRESVSVPSKVCPVELIMQSGKHVGSAHSCGQLNYPGHDHINLTDPAIMLESIVEV